MKELYLNLLILFILSLLGHSYLINLGFIHKIKNKHFRNYNRLNAELLPDNFFESSPKLVEEDPFLNPNIYFEKIMTKLGKTPKENLREIIAKYSVDQKLPLANQDMESHISLALDILWRHKNGDWDGLLSLVDSEVKEVVNFILCFILLNIF